MAESQSTKPTFAERFWARVHRAEGDVCWLWTGARYPKGYGKVALPRANGSPQVLDGAHRVAWLLTHGPVPAGLWVLHRCDNPPCCRPGHLFLGTHADNMRDMHEKGRGGTLGMRPSSARFTDAEVASIRARAQAGESHRSIARSLNADRRQIDRIVSGELYEACGRRPAPGLEGGASSA